MAKFRYATKELSINNAKAFVQAINSQDGRNAKNSTILYVCIGRTAPWPNDPNPINPDDNIQYLSYDAHRRFIGCKKVNLNDISHVIPRYNWISGTVYSMYRDTDIDVYERPWYVFTEDYNLYICLYNNKGVPSTVKPTGFSPFRFTTSDGYTWKYMYTVSLGEAQKFLTAGHIPVKTITTGDGSPESARQLAIQNAAVNGAIEIIETVNPGAGYFQIFNAAVSSAGKNTLRISTVGAGANASTEDNFYNGSSIYVISGTGSGQLRRITNWSGSTRTLSVNTAFATVCNTDSRVIISPTVTIVGDGKGAKAYSIVEKQTGAIANVNMITIGQNYTRAEVYVSANASHGTGATANVVISPLGGHGKDPVRQLASDKIMLNVQFQGSEGISESGRGYIPSNTEFRSISVLKDPVLKVNANNETVAVQSVANTSNSPQTLRMTTRLGVTYRRMLGNRPDPRDELEPNEILTNYANFFKAQLGTLEFVTELDQDARNKNALANAVKAANCNVVYVKKKENVDDITYYNLYINNVESYGDSPAFTKDDIILKADGDGTYIADVQTIQGPEANTFSGEILFTENIEPVVRDPDQIEDLKIILDF